MADVTGTVVDIEVDKTSSFTNVADLAHQLGESAKVRGCFFQQLLRQVTGSEVEPDSATLAQMGGLSFLRALGARAAGELPAPKRLVRLMRVNGNATQDGDFKPRESLRARSVTSFS